MNRSHAIVLVVLLALLSLTAAVTVTHARLPLITKRDMRKVLKEVFAELNDEFALADTREEINIPCPPALFRADKDVDSFLTTLNSLKCLDEKLVQLDTFIASSALPFSSQQALKIIAVFTKFDFVRRHVSQTMLLRVVELQSSEAIALIKSITENGAERMKILDTIKTNIKDLQTNKASIVSSLFTDEALKQKVASMLDSVKPFDCVFGSPVGDRIVFTIDISPSMTVKVAKNSQYTRLDFAKQHLAKTLNTLQPNQQFEIVYFCETSKVNFGKFVAATPENVASAIKTLNGMKDCGSTNIESGMRTSFGMIKPDMTGVNTVYLLSDGIPTAGLMDVTKLVALIKQLAEQSNTHVNTISVSLGNGVGNFFESNQDKENAAKVMNDIAFATGGAFKRLQSD